MKELTNICPYTTLHCTEPLLLCKRCPVELKAKDDAKMAFDRQKIYPKRPTIRPDVSVGGNPTGRKGWSIKIGVKGTF